MIDKDDKLFELLRKDVFAATYGEEPMPITPIPYGGKLSTSIHNNNYKSLYAYLYLCDHDHTFDVNLCMLNHDHDHG